MLGVGLWKVSLHQGIPVYLFIITINPNSWFKTPKQCG